MYAWGLQSFKKFVIEYWVKIVFFLLKCFVIYFLTENTDL